MNTKIIITRIFQGTLLLGSLIISFFVGNIYILIYSFIFLGLGGFFEEIIMNKFYSKGTKKISKRDKLSKKIRYSFLWTHSIIRFIKTYSTTIYDYKKIGYLTSIISYLTIALYVFIVTILYSSIDYYALLVYLIPVIANGYDFLTNKYFIY